MDYIYHCYMKSFHVVLTFHAAVKNMGLGTRIPSGDQEGGGGREGVVVGEGGGW